MRCLGRVARLVLLVVALITAYLVYQAYKNKEAIAVLTTLAPSATGQAQPPGSNLIPPPAGFKPESGYVVPPGTEIKGVGTVEKGFTFVGTEKVEFITGYKIKIPSEIDLAGFKIQIKQPDVILDLVLVGLKSIGVDDRQALTGMRIFGDESEGVTFTTQLNNSTFRVDAVIFRLGNTGAVAGVVYVDGQKPSVPVADIARQLEEQIRSGQ